MYTLYASKADCASLAPELAPAPCKFKTMDEAAQRCVELFRLGYTIHKVVLPSGTEIHQDQLEPALRIGVNSVRFAISR